MQVDWSAEAANDVAGIFEYIRPDNPSAARHISERIYERANSLGTFPYLGRSGRIEGTRELPVPSSPFIIVYRVLENSLEIVTVLHGAQRWPPA